MGQFTGQLGVCVVPGKCSLEEVKGTDECIFLLFLTNTSNPQRLGNKQTNKRTSQTTLRLPSPPSSLLLFFKTGRGAKGQKSNPCNCQPVNLTSVPSETMGQLVNGGWGGRGQNIMGSWAIKRFGLCFNVVLNQQNHIWVRFYCLVFWIFWRRNSAKETQFIWWNQKM